MSEIKLKSCPFCSGEAKFFPSPLVNGLFTVQCSDCDIDNNYWKLKRLAAINWNTRANPWRKIESADDLPKESGDYLWQYKADVMPKAKMSCEYFNSAIDGSFGYFLRNYSAWREQPEPFQE